MLIAKLKLGKTCALDDLMVAEMLLEAPEEVADIIAELFKLRLLNHASCDDDGIGCVGDS